MKPILKKIRLGLLSMAIVVSGGCLFGGTLTVFVDPTTGFASISVGGETGVNIGTCFELEPGGRIDCAINGITSGIETLTINELIFILILLDPVVVQLPADLTNFNGSYSHLDSSTGGALAITAGLGSVDIDVNRTLTAEPGTQLVIIGLPPGAPLTGNFNFNLNFNFPPGTTSIATKPIITGFAQLTDGSRYYPPILPCVDNMAAAPVLNIPIPVPGDALTLPPLTGLGCNNVTYDLIPAGAGPSAPAIVPALAPWSLLALAALLCGVGGVWLSLRRYRA